MTIIFSKNDKGEMIGELSNGNIFNIGKSRFFIYSTYYVDEIERFFDKTKQQIKFKYRSSDEIDKYLNKNNSIKIPELIFSYLICPDTKNITKQEYLHWKYLNNNGYLGYILKYFYYNLKNCNLNEIKE